MAAVLQVGLGLKLSDRHARLDEPLRRPHAVDKLEGKAVFLRTAPGVGDERLHFRGHCRECPLAQDHGLELIGIVRFGDVLLHFVELAGEEGDVAVTLPVDQALLERGEGFRPRDRHRVRPPCLIAGEQDGALRVHGT